MHENALNWTKEATDGPNWAKWNEVDRIDKIELNGSKVDRIEPKRIEWTKCGLNKN